MIVFVGIILSLLIVLSLSIIVTGKVYVFKLIYVTFFKGKSGPSIYDLGVFPRRIVKRSLIAKKLNVLNKHFVFSLPKKNKNLLKKYKTTSFIVLKNNEIIFERYYKGATHSTLSNSFSMAKSILALLIAVAVEEKLINSLKDPVSKYLFHYRTPEREHLCIEHFMNMSTGMDWNESSINPYSENAQAYYGDDIDGFMRTITYSKEAGINFDYVSGATQILGEILIKVSGKSIADYASEKIWSKIGTARNAYWSLDHKYGVEKAFCCFYASTRDYARLGQVVLNNGVHEGEQIIPQWFISDIKKPAMHLFDVELEERNHRYKYQWWMMNYRGREIQFMRGILGQYIFILPSENMVVVRTGHKRDSNKKNGHPLDVYAYLDSALLISRLNK